MTHEGYSSRYIANIIECHQSTIVRNINRINERQKSLLPLPKTGGKRISTETDDRRLMRIYKSNKRMTARDLQAEWHLDACSQTIRNRLKEHGIKNYSTTEKPQLSSKIIQQCLEFCKKYESWSVEDWNTVVFSNKTNIQAEPNGGHRKVWRKPTEKLLWLCFKYSKEVSNINNDMGMHFCPWNGRISYPGRKAQCKWLHQHLGRQTSTVHNSTISWWKFLVSTGQRTLSYGASSELL